MGVLTWNWRQAALLVLMVAASLVVGRRLIDLQVIQHDALAQKAHDQYVQFRTLQPTRGMIYDADNEPLVTNQLLYKVAAFPQKIADDDAKARGAVTNIATILGKDDLTLWGLIQNAQRQKWPYVRLAENISDDVATQLSNLHIPWLDLVPHDRPAYPNGQLASQTLGFMLSNPNDLNVGYGQYGLQQYYDQQLRGITKTVPAGDPLVRPSGASLYLTVRSAVQLEVEQTLADTVRSSRADGGVAIVMDPHTGAILAMAGNPTYDPNLYYKVKNKDYSVYQNPAVSWTYEPGSTFKVLTIAAGLDSGKITPQTTVEDWGHAQCGGWALHNWDNGNGWGVETPTIMLRHSANIGALKFAQMMGKNVFYRYVANFGLNQPTGVDVTGEVGGHIVFPDDPHGWWPCNLLTNSYGQGLQVTPLQLITAVAAVANDGWMMRPYVVRQIQQPSSGGLRTTTVAPHRVRQVISAQTAHVLTDILEESAKDGEAQKALVDGYGVAAKTGTASVAGNSGCGYNCGLGTIASIIGFAPAHHPRFVMLIVIKHPQTQQWGSVIAAPAFNTIAQRLLLMMGVRPNSPEAR